MVPLFVSSYSVVLAPRLIISQGLLLTGPVRDYAMKKCKRHRTVPANLLHDLRADMLERKHGPVVVDHLNQKQISLREHHPSGGLEGGAHLMEP